MVIKPSKIVGPHSSLVISIFVCQYSEEVVVPACARKSKQLKVFGNKFNWKCKCFAFFRE